jgi:hypothetical protein
MQHKAKVFWWMMLGYAVVFAILVFQLALLGMLIWLHLKSEASPILIWCGYTLVGLGLFGTIKSLFLRIPLPDGVVIDRRGFPYLYDLVEALRKPMRLKKKKLEILVDWDFNASAISRPAFGIIGPSTHYIRFGLPPPCIPERRTNPRCSCPRTGSSFQKSFRIRHTNWSSIYPRANYTFLPSSLRFGDSSEIVWETTFRPTCFRFPTITKSSLPR